MFRQFLAHFMPSMPAFHEGLFGRDGTSPGLLLTAISMGSLYVGSTEALTQGVSMWRLAGSAIWGAVSRIVPLVIRAVSELISSAVSLRWSNVDAEKFGRADAHVHHRARFCHHGCSELRAPLGTRSALTDGAGTQDRQIYQTARLVFPLAISAGHELGLFLRKKTNSTCVCPPELAGCQYIETAAQEDILQQLWRAWVREQEDRR